MKWSNIKVKKAGELIQDTRAHHSSKVFSKHVGWHPENNTLTCKIKKEKEKDKLLILKTSRKNGKEIHVLAMFRYHTQFIIHLGVWRLLQSTYNPDWTPKQDLVFPAHGIDQIMNVLKLFCHMKIRVNRHFTKYMFMICVCKMYIHLNYWKIISLYNVKIIYLETLY